MKPRVNYVIATWSGSRYNPSKDYLKLHVRRLFELHHNLDQVTIVIPLGSDNADFYDIGDHLKERVVFLHRPANDRSYGQFIYAYQQYADQFDYYIIAEDDYCPNIDDFDQKLVSMIEEKGCDYLCGKYGTQRKSDPMRAIHNQGIVRASAFKKLLEACPEPKFPVMGPEDGTEQTIFSQYFTNNGMTIADYSDKYSVPYWTKTLTYFTKKESFNTIFVPIQCIDPNTPDHFLWNIQCEQTSDEGTFRVVIPNINLYPHDSKEVELNSYSLTRIGGKLHLKIQEFHEGKLYAMIANRVAWMNRGEDVYIILDDNADEDYLFESHWVKTEDPLILIKDRQYD